MKWMAVLVFSQSLLTSAATSEIPVRATWLKLTKEMERLNGSPYFESKVDEWRAVMINALKGNVVGGKYERPELWLGALRRKKENGPEELWLQLMLFSERARDTALVTATQSLFMVIDGVKVTLEPEQNENALDVDKGLVSECMWYPVNADFLRMLGSAKKAQLRVEGQNLDVFRELSRTNLARFKVFVNAFIDGAGPPKGGTPYVDWRPGTRLFNSRMVIEGPIKGRLENGLLVWSGYDRQVDAAEYRSIIRRHAPDQLPAAKDVTHTAKAKNGTPVQVFVGPCVLMDYPGHESGEVWVNMIAYPNGKFEWNGGQVWAFTCNSNAVKEVADEGTLRILRGAVTEGDVSMFKASRGSTCSGGMDCKVCTDCSRCEFCRKGGRCGVCARK